ncbi:amino acid ABC transporter ATP-binding protein [Kerstersia similis]|uniref:amino acid ABC transporter ATP-binding protein n=1 Tax=Kerstersia similis TaxID=206505 RepID=UPI0039EFDB1C
MSQNNAQQSTSNTPGSTDSRPVVVKIRGLNKWYGNYHALKNIDLDVHQGERIILCGPSGSGKSTLIRCINQLERIEKGSIEIHGTDVTRQDSQATIALRDVGMVFQHFNLFPHMSVLDNCTLAPVSVKGENRKRAEAKARELLEKVGMSNHADKYPTQLSGGQQQRVAIARTLCMDPKIILFDEPTAALDPEMVKEVLDVMVKLANTGITMLCVTHEMGFAKQMAERVLFLDHGSILEDTPPLEFFASPSTDRARAFLQQIL